MKSSKKKSNVKKKIRSSFEKETWMFDTIDQKFLEITCIVAEIKAQ